MLGGGEWGIPRWQLFPALLRLLLPHQCSVALLVPAWCCSLLSRSGSPLLGETSLCPDKM